MSYAELSDIELVQRTQGGERSCFEELFHRYSKKVWKNIASMVSEKESVEEVHQEVFYQAFRSISTFEGKSAFYTWLFRITRNMALQWLHKTKRRHTREPPIDEVPETLFRISNDHTSPHTHAERSELYKALLDAINSLPSLQRKAMILYAIQGMSYIEIAHILGTSTNSVKGALHRARGKMRKYMETKRISKIAHKEVQPAPDLPKIEPKKSKPRKTKADQNIRTLRDLIRKILAALLRKENGEVILEITACHRTPR